MRALLPQAIQCGLRHVWTNASSYGLCDLFDLRPLIDHLVCRSLRFYKMILCFYSVSLSFIANVGFRSWKFWLVTEVHIFITNLRQLGFNMTPTSTPRFPKYHHTKLFQQKCYTHLLFLPRLTSVFREFGIRCSVAIKQCGGFNLTIRRAPYLNEIALTIRITMTGGNVIGKTTSHVLRIYWDNNVTSRQTQARKNNNNMKFWHVLARLPLVIQKWVSSVTTYGPKAMIDSSEERLIHRVQNTSGPQVLGMQDRKIIQCRPSTSLTHHDR